jgi:hypothetical protein
MAGARADADDQQWLTPSIIGDNWEKALMGNKNEILLGISSKAMRTLSSVCRRSVGEVGERSLKGIDGKVGEAHNSFDKLKEPVGALREALAPFLEGATLAETDQG